MITDAIGEFLLTVVNSFLGFLPVAGTLDLSGFGAAVGAFRAFDAALPASEIIALAGVGLAVVGGIFLFRLALTVWHAIPGKFS